MIVIQEVVDPKQVEREKDDDPRQLASKLFVPGVTLQENVILANATDFQNNVKQYW